MLFDTDGLQEILLTLKQNKLRSFLTAFGVFWGILMLVAMLGAGKGLYHGVTDDFSRFASNAVYLWTRVTTLPYQGLPKGRTFRMDNDDVAALRESIPEIDRIAPRIELANSEGKNNVSHGSKTGTFDVYGDYPDIIHIRLLDIVKGRFLNDLDIEQNRKVAIIGDRIYQELFEPGVNPIGQYLEISGIYFQVVGVFTIENLGDEDQDDLKTVYIPLTTFQRSFNYGRQIAWLSFTAKQGISAEMVTEKTIRLLSIRHKIAPEDKRAFGYWNSEAAFNKVTRVFVGVNFLIWFVGVFTLIAGVIGVSNIMLIVVKERTREIGIRRAVGATPFHIVGQILTESVLLTSFSGYWGLVVGVGILELVSSLLSKSSARASMFSRPEVDFEVALLALGILTVAGIVAGLIPAKRAISIKPVDAIRSE